jgi:hypothetical protein
MKNSKNQIYDYNELIQQHSKHKTAYYFFFNGWFTEQAELKVPQNWTKSKKKNKF